MRLYDSVRRDVIKRRVAEQALAKMGELGNCELFVVGLNEVGLLGGREWWWDCELFQIGLRELGLA